MIAKCGILCHSKYVAVCVVTDTLNICIFVAIELELSMFGNIQLMSCPMFGNVRLNSCLLFGNVRLRSCRKFVFLSLMFTSVAAPHAT
jgi:hypothetical protein